jgi:positive control factor
VKKLLFEYKQTLKETRKLYQKYKDEEELTEKGLIGKEIISSMISDLEYAIDWLETGRNPDARRGIDKQGVYSMNPLTLDQLEFEKSELVQRELTREEKELIEDALCRLSKREKDAFMLVKVEGVSFKDAAELMGIKKTTAQTHVERAEKKIEQRKNESLFLVS